MEIKKTWTASSESRKIEKREELRDIAGRWGVGIEVRITRPYIYSQGPLKRRTTNEEIDARETLPMASTVVIQS